MNDYRLVPPAVAAWAVAWWLAPAPNWPVTLGLWALTGVMVGLAVRWRILAILAVALAAGALVATVIAARSGPDVPRSVDAVATVTETVYGSPFEADLDGAPVLVFWDPEGPPIPLGAQVWLNGRSEPVDERIRALVFAHEVAVTAEPGWLLAAGQAARTGLLTATEGLPSPGGELLPGLAVGDTSRVGPALDRAMEVASLSHLTAVSGANCAIVVGLVMLVLRGLPLWARTTAALAALGAFVVLVTPQPSVLRAAVMAVVVLVAMARGRPASGIPVLGLSVVVLLIADPWLAREYGFALSVLATAGLLVLAPRLATRLEQWMPSGLALVVSVPVAAQAACQPVLVLLDPSLPAYGVVANLLAAPAAPAATVLGLAVCTLAVVSPALAAALAPLAWLPAAWVGAVAEFFADLPLSSLPWPVPPVGVALLVGILVLLVVRPAFAAAGLVLVLAAGAGVRAGDLLDRPADWQFAMCDVGQGDALLARSGGLVMLVDTGPDPDALTECLGDLGIGRVDLLVLTHFDGDHVGGAPAVAGLVERVLVGPTDDGADEGLVGSLALAGAEIVRARVGDTGVLGHWRWRILWPDEHVPPGNDASVAVALEPLDRSVLSAVLLGDLGEQAQKAMAAAARLGDVDVVKVSHHGSADQSAVLYERLRAAVGLIGVGADNGYGHPTDRLLGILSAVGTLPVRTDLHGLVLLRATGEGEVAVWTEHVGPGG